MKVANLFLKRQHGDPANEYQMLKFERGKGIDSDINARVGSPRQILIVTQEVLTRFHLQAGALGENIVLKSPVENLENSATFSFTSGMILQLGEQTLIRLTFLCEPCSHLDKLQPGLAKRIKGHRGFLGMVVRDGIVKVGDRVSVIPEKLPAIPEEVKQRFTEFVSRIPKGHIVTTPDLLMAMGVTHAYYRAIPTFLKKASPDLPIHRIIRSDRTLLSDYIPQQKQLLEAEGITLISEKIVGEGYNWEAMNFYPLGTW